jgi:hypothetical protein
MHIPHHLYVVLLELPCTSSGQRAFEEAKDFNIRRRLRQPWIAPPDHPGPNSSKVVAEFYRTNREKNICARLSVRLEVTWARYRRRFQIPWPDRFARKMNTFIRLRSYSYRHGRALVKIDLALYSTMITVSADETCQALYTICSYSAA